MPLLNTNSVLTICRTVAIMKFNIAIITAIALQITGVISMAAPEAVADAAIVAECGALGVMSVTDGANPDDVRKCADHPIGAQRNRVWQSLAPAEFLEKRTPADLKGGDIFARKEQACYYDAGLGCSGGYCWKACGSPGDGKWCWTAGGDGSGAWLTCKTYNDCNPGSSCGKGFGCKACGCSC